MKILIWTMALTTILTFCFGGYGWHIGNKSSMDSGEAFNALDFFLIAGIFFIIDFISFIWWVILK